MTGSLTSGIKFPMSFVEVQQNSRLDYEKQINLRSDSLKLARIEDKHVLIKLKKKFDVLGLEPKIDTVIRPERKRLNRKNETKKEDGRHGRLSL